MSEKKNKLKGIFGTLIIHLILVLLLVIFGFTTKLPLPEEEGVEVNLGNDIEGFGDIQIPKPASRPTSAPPKQSDDEKDIMTQNVEDAPFLEDNKGDKKEDETINTKTEPKNPVEEKPKVNPNALYKGKNQSANQDQNEGDGEKDGDKGNLNGIKDSDNYLGNDNQGNGLSYSLAGRKPRFLPKPSKKFSEDGTVVVQITVNQYGKVIKAVAIAKGSNTTSTTLRKLAEQAALNAKFDAKPDVPEVQRGTITYHFKVRD